MDQTKLKVVSQIYEAPAQEVIIPEGRIRKEFNIRKLRNLVVSFKKLGQGQPGICRLESSPEGTQIILVAGERRLKASLMAELPYRFSLSNETDPIKIREIELEENTCREDLTWQEQVDAVEELHMLKQQQFGVAQVGVKGGHKLADTAELMNVSVGQVTEDIKLAIMAKQFEEVRNAKSKSEAKKIIKRLEEDYERLSKQEELLKKEEELGEISIEETKDLSFEEKQLLYFDKFILEGKMEIVLKDYPDEHFDIVIFDPPWRVGLDSVRKKGGGTDDFEDSKMEHGEFEDELREWLKLLYNKMAPNSHLYLFFGIINHTSIYKILEEIGFSTNRIPFIWYKQGAHVTRNPDIWPGRSYEPIAFGRKGSKRITRPGSPDVIITPAPTPSMKQSHPSAKHPSIMVELLERSALPGDKVLDPMCGSGMTGVACEVLSPKCKLDWIMIEEKENFRLLSLANVVRGYSRIVNVLPTEVGRTSMFFICRECGETDSEDKLSRTIDNTEFCPKCQSGDIHFSSSPIVESFKELEIGSDEWKLYWKTHPKDQEEMLNWRKEKEN